ncbi:MAG TPA: hypothetical protein VFD59_01115 [Nocardioidaceae bacterium]|nr:hypothetical protein [Nocardioidaceae bacterium]
MMAHLDETAEPSKPLTAGVGTGTVLGGVEIEVTPRGGVTITETARTRSTIVPRAV